MARPQATTVVHNAETPNATTRLSILLKTATANMRALVCLLPAFARCATCGGTVRAPSGMALPLANVSACGTSVLTDGGGEFSIECDQSHGAPPWDAAVWARQYEPRASASVHPHRGTAACKFLFLRSTLRSSFLYTFCQPRVHQKLAL